jgi:hypothetical protein
MDGRRRYLVRLLWRSEVEGDNREVIYKKEGSEVRLDTKHSCLGMLFTVDVHACEQHAQLVTVRRTARAQYEMMHQPRELLNSIRIEQQ